jgi:signal transduction histidine kinase
VLVTFAATMLGQPARTRLTRLAARRAFGRRVSGFELLVAFGTTLEHAFDPRLLAPQLARGVREGLGLRWVRVQLATAGLGQTLSTGLVGDPDRDPDGPRSTVPVRYGQEVLGAIECGPKTEGRFTPQDQDLVQTLARQVALAVHNARLTAQLAVRVHEIQEQASELRASRARIVHAQDAERRRIERRLHDGCQQELVVLVTKLRLARNRLRRAPDGLDAALAEIQDDAYRLIDALRELAHGIHPPVLTDQGLVAAVTSCARRLPIPVAVTVADALRSKRFALDIEEAAFYLVSEALTNILKHADATGAAISIARKDGALLLTVSDDGVGLPPDAGAGSGLTGMRDRVEATGGELLLISRPGRGTTVHARFTDRARGVPDA